MNTVFYWEYAIIVSQNQTWVSVYKRFQGKDWLNTDYFSMEEEIVIGDAKFIVSDIYEKIVLTQNK